MNFHWKWAEIFTRCDEIFALTTGAHGTVALWASLKRTVKLKSGTFYRLDYLEVHPAHLKTDVAVLAYGFAYMRVRELDRAGVLLSSFTETADIYREMRFEEKCLEGWIVADGMVPFIGSAIVLDAYLKEFESNVHRREEAADVST